MKKKYYFVILFLILTMFFIINTSSVNAIMYKILDSEGNIIRLTNNPVLSIKEKEAGYTISPPPGGSIEAMQDQITNGQENKQETSSGSEKCDFRETNWGMSKEQVKEIEKNILLIEEDVMQDSIKGSDGNLYFKDKVNGLECEVYYYFMKNRLVSATYKKIGSIQFKDEYINNYKNLKSYLIKKYGRPNENGIEMIKDETIAPFAMVFWENPTDSIYQILLLLMDVEDRNEIEWVINYQSEEGKNIKENLVDYTEKEKAKKEAEAQIEARKKELENEPKAEIKFVDSTSRLSKSGDYYYVEGVLKNNGKGNAYHVEVEIRSLDKYGKLVSIDNGYAHPTTIAPGKEATYQIMVSFNSKIDSFDKTVNWSNNY